MNEISSTDITFGSAPVRSDDAGASKVRSLRIRVEGQVQGVGYRPFVWQLARRLDLRGNVANDPRGVVISACGGDIDKFLAALVNDAPRLARVDRVTRMPFDGETIPQGFEILPSHGYGTHTDIAPDAATCPDCTQEIRQASERRHGYAFTNCTQCGPRFSIVNAMPYDRYRTAMASFDMCRDCTAEYTNPADRRFHAQPIACPKCGPRVWLEVGGKTVAGDAIQLAAMQLKRGAILGIKGVGGFHLACDATNATAIETLRHRKHRLTKPLALMGTLDMIAQHATITDDEYARLTDPAAPITLLPMMGKTLPDQIAPNQATLGWMLPYTPLHHLLIDAFAGPLVMTSGNLSGEPQVIGNEEAHMKLSGIADGFVMHDRPITRRLDDSVERMTSHGAMILRRGRGRVPETLPLPTGFEHAPDVLAVGGHLKSAICLLKNNQALLSHHLGDLRNAASWDAFCKTEKDYAALFDHTPNVIACDLHPGYRSSAYAERRAEKPVKVQHHHAHLAACLGENCWPLHGGPVAGIILDGLGFGSDGTLWGGELLLGTYHGFSRIAHLRPAPLIGGDAAGRAPWRNLLARLDQAGLHDLADGLLAGYPVDQLRGAANSGFNSPFSSSVGRLFDAFAAALDICRSEQGFEGEAAMRLEALAESGRTGLSSPYPLSWSRGVCDPVPLFRAWASDRCRETPVPVMAARFHAGLARAFCKQARRLITAGRAHAIALSGGCFQNAMLLNLCMAELADLPVLIHTKTPANDGGLALGQALVAAAQNMRGPHHA